MENLPEGTVSIGLGGAIFGGLGARGGAELAFDTQGNVALFAGGGGGGYLGVGFNNVGPNVKITNAPTVDKLKGWSVQLGASAGEVASIGGEWVMFSDDKGTKYHGINIAGGAALQGPPVEVHFTLE